MSPDDGFDKSIKDNIFQEVDGTINYLLNNISSNDNDRNKKNQH